MLDKKEAPQSRTNPYPSIHANITMLHTHYHPLQNATLRAVIMAVSTAVQPSVVMHSVLVAVVDVVQISATRVYTCVTTTNAWNDVPKVC